MTETVPEDVQRSQPPAEAGAPATSLAAGGGSGAVVRAVVLALAVTALVQAGLLALINRPDWWNGFVAAAVITLLSAGLSLPPLVWGLRSGLMKAVVGYFISAGIRMLIVIVGFVLAVFAGGYEPLPTVVLVMLFYLVLLGVESAYLGRAVWNMKAEN